MEYTPEERSRILIAQERIRNQVKVRKSDIMLTESFSTGQGVFSLGVVCNEHGMIWWWNPGGGGGGVGGACVPLYTKAFITFMHALSLVHHMPL